MTGGSRQSRRAVLTAALGAALAGCSDRSPGATPTGDDETPSQTAAPAAVTCTSLTEAYDRYDAGETPLVLDFEYPAVFTDRVTYREPNVVRGNRETTEGGRRLSFGVEQGVPTDGAPDRDRLTDAGWRGAFQVRIDGVSQRVYGRGRGATGRTGSAERLCYLRLERGGDVRHARIRAAVRVGPNRGEVDENCARALDRAADRVFRSAAVNEDATVLF